MPTGNYRDNNCQSVAFPGISKQITCTCHCRPYHRAAKSHFKCKCFHYYKITIKGNDMKETCKNGADLLWCFIFAAKTGEMDDIRGRNLQLILVWFA